jgi:hypothetical protein
MNHLLVDESLRILGLSRAATWEDVRAAYRRLAKIYHPDVCDPRLRGSRRFVEVVGAYRTLKEEMGTEPGERRSPCPRCGQRATLLEGLDGGLACAECLLGETRRRRRLPMPVMVVIRHVAVFGLYALSASLAVTGSTSGSVTPMVWSLGFALAGLGLLAGTVVRVEHAR